MSQESHRNVSDFIVAAARAEAHRTIEEMQVICLSLKGQRQFVDLLLNLPPLDSAMQRAG